MTSPLYTTMSSPNTKRLPLLNPKHHPSFKSRLKTSKHSRTGRCPKFYFTSGTRTKEDEVKRMNAEISKPYTLAFDLSSLKEVKKFWEDEKNKKVTEQRAKYTKKHNYQSRLTNSWKRERLYIPEDVILPGKSITENIDPDFFTLTSGRPIKEKTNLRKYLTDIRQCFLTRLKTGYLLDEILLMEEQHTNEKKKLSGLQKNFESCLKGFESFLKEDHVSSSAFLETVKEETEKSRDKLEQINKLKNELKNLQAEILVSEGKWRSCKMFQKFLFIISPSEWRRANDPYYGKEDVGNVASDPCFFDSFREFPGNMKVDLDEKITKFKDDIRLGEPPKLYFSAPEEVLLILKSLEKNNLIALAHSKELDFPAEKMTADLEKSRMYFEEEQKHLEKEIKFMRNLVEAEEKKTEENRRTLREVAFGLFKDLITNEEYLSVMSYVEDVYEDAVTQNDSNLGLMSMIKQIELKHESLLLALDHLPNEIVVHETKKFYKEQKRELKEALEAEKKVHQMEILLKRLSKSLESPKKRWRERKMVHRSQPPEEIMLKYELPKILTKEERNNLFFFEKSENAKLYKPLYS